MTEPLSPEDEASVRHWIAQHEFMTPTLGHGVAALEVLPRLLATLDAARQPAPEAALRHAHPSVHPSQCEACAALAAPALGTPEGHEDRSDCWCNPTVGWPGHPLGLVHRNPQALSTLESSQPTALRLLAEHAIECPDLDYDDEAAVVAAARAALAALAPDDDAPVEACEFVPAHEPWSCSTHPGGIRTSLDVDRCARVIPAHLEAVGAWSVESGDDDHNPWVLRDGQRIAEVWGPDDIGSEADARLIVDALNATARQPAPEGGLREAARVYFDRLDAVRSEPDPEERAALGVGVDRAEEALRAALAAAPTPDPAAVRDRETREAFWAEHRCSTPDPAAPDLRSSAAWLVQRWDGNRTVEPDALRADIAVLRSALRGATPGLGGKPRG